MDRPGPAKTSAIARRAGLDLHGVRQIGGLEVAAALAAPAPLSIDRTGADFEGSWTSTPDPLADAGHVLRLDAGRPAPEAAARWIDAGE